MTYKGGGGGEEGKQWPETRPLNMACQSEGEEKEHKQKHETVSFSTVQSIYKQVFRIILQHFL